MGRQGSAPRRSKSPRPGRDTVHGPRQGARHFCASRAGRVAAQSRASARCRGCSSRRISPRSRRRNTADGAEERPIHDLTSGSSSGGAGTRPAPCPPGRVGGRRSRRRCHVDRCGSRALVGEGAFQPVAIGFAAASSRRRPGLGDGAVVEEDRDVPACGGAPDRRGRVHLLARDVCQPSCPSSCRRQPLAAVQAPHARGLGGARMVSGCVLARMSGVSRSTRSRPATCPRARGERARKSASPRAPGSALSRRWPGAYEVVVDLGRAEPWPPKRARLCGRPRGWLVGLGAWRSSRRGAWGRS